MPAAVTDKFIKTGAATKTTLASPGKAVGASSINISSATNWPTDTAVVFAIRTIELVDGEYEEVSGTYTEWLGTVSGTTVNNLILAYGTDQVYAAGSTTEVFIPISSYAHNRLIDGLLVAHDQDGTLKDNAVGTANLQALAVSTSKLADDAVTSDKLNPSKTLDANGWTVYDYGNWKEYTKRTASATGALATGATRDYNFSNYPVGITQSNLTSGDATLSTTFVVTSATAWQQVSHSSLSTSGGMQVSIRNQSASSNTIDGFAMAKIVM